MTKPTRLVIEGDAATAVPYIALAKRLLKRFTAQLPAGGFRYLDLGDIKMRLLWTPWIDKIRIEARLAGGFLVLLDHTADFDFEGWGFDATGTPVKLVDIPQSDDWVTGDGFLSLYYRAEQNAAGYAFTAESTGSFPKFGWHVLQPFVDGLLKVLQSGLPSLFFSPRGRSYSDGKFIYGGAGTTNLYGFGDPGKVPTVSLPTNLGETELGGALALRDARFLPSGNLQYAARRETTTHANLYVQEWAVDFPSEVVTPAAPETLDGSRNYRGGTLAGQSAIGSPYATPLALGAVSRFELLFAGNPAVNTFHQPGGGDYGDTAVRTLGMPVWIASGHIGGANPVMIADDPVPTTVTMTPGNIVLHSDTLNLSGDAYMVFVHAYPVHAGGFDYWHVYTASAKPTIAAATGIYNFDVSYPLVTTLTFRVVRSDGVVMHTSNGGWTQTDGTPSYSGTPAAFKVYVPHGAANGWIAGSIVTFGPGFTTTISPGQWTPDLATVHQYAGFDLTNASTSAPSPHEVTAVSRLLWYVAADNTGAYFVIFDGTKAYAVEMGAAGVPVELVDPAAQSSTHAAPAADNFSFFTTARS